MSSTMASSGKKLVAVLQFTANQFKAENFRICESLITDAKKRGAEMVFLPEGFDFIAETSQESATMSEPLDGITMSSYRALAKGLGIWLSLGGFHLKNDSDSRMHNCHVVLNPAGDVVATYNKIHLFDVDIPGKVSLSESRYCIPGTKVLQPVDTPVGKVGLMCCYDLRFPELSALLTQKGAEILTYPSAFTKVTGEAHWEILLRARAIENQCYVVAAAQAGQHNAKRQSHGHSMIVDPWGAIIAQCDETPGIAMAEIDQERLRDVRRNMPVASHRRSDLYHLRTAPEVLSDFTTEKHNFGGHVISKNEVFFETALSLAFVNLKPVVPGHSLVIPKRSAKKFRELSSDETSDLFYVVQRVGNILEERYGVNSLTIAIQDGYDAGQTVKHVHVHLLPRKPNDFEKDEVYKELESHDKGENRRARTPQEMATEAAELRPLMYGQLDGNRTIHKGQQRS